MLIHKVLVLDLLSTLLSSVTTITPFLTTHYPTVALGQQGIPVAWTRRFGLAKAPDASSRDAQNYFNRLSGLSLTLMLTRPGHLPINQRSESLHLPVVPPPDLARVIPRIIIFSVPLSHEAIYTSRTLSSLAALCISVITWKEGQSQKQLPVPPDIDNVLFFRTNEPCLQVCSLI